MKTVFTAIIASLATAYLTYYFTVKLKKRDASLISDITTYKIFMQILPWQHTMEYMRSHDFHNSFDDRLLKGLYEFQQHCKTDPAFVFNDPALEKLRQNLFSDICNFASIIAKHSFRSDSSEWRKIYPDLDRDDPKVKKNAQSLNVIADKICITYDSLVQTAQKTLAAKEG